MFERMESGNTALVMPGFENPPGAAKNQIDEVLSFVRQRTATW